MAANAGPARIANPSLAEEIGIETVCQDLAPVDTLDVAGSMFLGRDVVRAGAMGSTGAQQPSRSGGWGSTRPIRCRSMA